MKNLSDRLRAIGVLVVAVIAMQLMSFAKARADITAANAQQDRGPFVKCGNAIDVMSESNDARIAATLACANALKLYSQKMENAKTNDDGCRYALYAGSSAERYGYVLSTSMNQDGSKKSYALGDKILDMVVGNCAGNPNIISAAKAIRRASHQK